MQVHPAPIRLIVVGAGATGRTHIDRIARAPGLSLAGIADPSETARQLADSIGVPYAPDPVSALERFAPHGAIVATPNATHVPVALECLSHGVAALVEKPVADSVAEAKQLVQAQASSGVPVLVGKHRRHNPITRPAREPSPAKGSAASWARTPWRASTSPRAISAWHGGASPAADRC